MMNYLIITVLRFCPKSVWTHNYNILGTLKMPAERGQFSCVSEATDEF